VDDEGGGGAPLVLVRQHSEVLVGGDGAVDGVGPGEDWRRLAAALDLPEGGPVDPDNLGACLTLVYGWGQIFVSAEMWFGLG